MANTEPSFVFDGTVTALGRSTEPLLPPGDLTALVRVDSVVRAPEAMGALAGREITVQLRRPAKVGEAARFSARGLLYGKSVAVEEVGTRKTVPARPARTAEASGEREESARELDQAQRLRSGLRTRAADASAIVVGRVVSIGGPDTGRAVSKRGRQPEGRLSEHDPQWSTATVAVDRVLKGRTPKSVQVVFSNSQDVMWYRAPKLVVGQSAVLMLRKGVPEAPSKTASVVLDELDVQSADRAALVASLL